MKKAKFIVVLLIVCLASSLISCGTVATTKRYFKGEPSRLVYSTFEDAVEGFFEEQISGGNDEYQIVSAEISHELTKSEIRNFSLEPYEFIKVKSGNRLIINYLCANIEYSHDFCVLELDDGFIYYLQEPLEGEAIAATYYDYFVSADNFENVTAKTNGTITIKEDGLVKIIEVDILLKTDGDVIEFGLSFRTFFNGGVNDTYFGGYVIKTDSGYVSFGMDSSGRYVETTSALIGMFNENDVVRLVLNLSNLYLSGHNKFVLMEDRFVLREIEKQALNDVFLRSQIASAAGEITASDYVVDIVGNRIYIASANVSAGALSLFVEKKFSDYNKTKIYLPEEIQEYLESINVAVQ